MHATPTSSTRDGSWPGSGPAFALLALALLLASIAFPAPASAAAPPLLWQTPEDLAPGESAGRFSAPVAVAADPVSGQVYVSDRFNFRIAQFTPWGKFVKAWGWDVAPEGAPGDTPSDRLEVCTAICKKGVQGDGPGQFNFVAGITVDGGGDVYAFDRQGEDPGGRVQKFDQDGDFLLMWGGEVNKTTKAEICTRADLEGGEECGAGVEGTADGWFSTAAFRDFVDYNPATSSIFVGDKDRIQEFGLDGSFKGKIELEGQFDQKSVHCLAANPTTGDLYICLASSFFIAEDGVHRLDPASGEVTATLPVQDAIAAAVDWAGTVYALKGTVPVGEVVAFDSAGAPIPGMEEGDRFAEASSNTGSTGRPFPAGLATNVLGPGSEEPGNLYVSYTPFGTGAYLNAYGPPPIAFEDPPALPPEIEAQYATSVGIDTAIVGVEINPRFWQDATYYVQYGTKACPDAGWEGPACGEKPASPGVLLTGEAVNVAVRSAGVPLDGLEPDTTYHYRFVATSGGGGPVIGRGGKPGEPGDEATFTTFALPDPTETCLVNQRFRTGPGARLPDCRAYELVSPLDKLGADATMIGEVGLQSELSQSALSGERFTFSSKRAFADAEAGAYISQYLSSRNAGEGWVTQAVAPPRTLRTVGVGGAVLNEFHAFSADLCQAWLRHNYEPVLAPGAVDGYPNLYRRDNCATPASYEALNTVMPPNRSPELFYHLRIQGASRDGTHAIFNANGKLAATAPALPEEGEAQLYEHIAGEAEPRFVCVLPNDNPSALPCAAGGPVGTGGGTESSVQGAISEDGSRIFWTQFSGGLSFFEGSPGRIYVRIDGADTVAVSQSVSGEPAWFWGAAADGSRAVFQVVAGPLKGNLYEFDVETKTSTLIAKEVGDSKGGLLGMSEDASHVYLTSREDHDAGGPAAAGHLNLYLYEADGRTLSYIATLAAADLTGQGTSPPSPVTRQPVIRLARVSPDGRHAAFVSRASLTGYENNDVNSGTPDREVFLYDADQDELRCVSCNPTGARPNGENGVAAAIPAWERPTYASRVLSDDGQRLFFESHEALAPRDTNGTWDVYQWEAAGTGSCETTDAGYGEAAGGCVELISSGQSAKDSRFLDADASGADVFFATLSSLVPQDYDLIDVYDARIGGGFPAPQANGGCEGDTCQSPPPVPEFPPAASAAYQGPGDPRAESPPGRRPCPKGKRRVRRGGKARCVKKPRKARRSDRRQRR